MKRWILSISAIVLVLVIYFLPNILSSTVGKRVLLEAIEKKTHTKASVENVHLSWLGPQMLSKLSLTSDEFNGTIDELQVGVPIWTLPSVFELKKLNHLNGDVKLTGGLFEFQSQNFPAVRLTDIETTIRLHHQVADLIANGKASFENQEGSFSLTGQIQKIDSAFTIHGDLKSFPTLPIARILNAKKKIDENNLIRVVGPSLDLSGSISLSHEKGSLDLTIHAPNIDSEIHGDILNRDLMLREPLIASIRLTPELSRWLMRKMNPLFLTAIDAKSPIKLRIERHNFHSTIFPFEISRLQIDEGYLDMGQIQCSNGGTLAALIGILKNNLLSSTQEMTIWFAPLHFRLQNGLLHTRRMDALVADTIHICTWGTIDLIRDKVDMNLGITAETLKSSFKIENLPMDYVLTIPISGTTKKPNLVTGMAVAKITALLTAQHKPNAWFADKILDIFGHTDTTVPPPIRPYPWEK